MVAREISEYRHIERHAVNALLRQCVRRHFHHAIVRSIAHRLGKYLVQF